MMKQCCPELIDEINIHLGECQRTYGKTAQWLRASAALPEGWCSVPRSSDWQLTTAGKKAAGDLMPSVDFQRHAHMLANTHYTHVSKTK